VGKGVNPAAGTPEADAQMLLEEIMPVARLGLENEVGFLPIGALVQLDGVIHRVVYDGNREGPVSQATAKLLDRLQQEVKGGTARSVAMAADVRIWRRADGDEASNAVSVHVEHQDGYCVDLLIPYKVRKGMFSRIRRKPQVIFRKMIAQDAERVVWAGVAKEGKREGYTNADET